MKEQIDGLDEFGEAVNQGKQIYMVSDGTGWTAENSVNAALGQFENCLVDRGCPINTHLFSGVFSSFTPLILFFFLFFTSRNIFLNKSADFRVGINYTAITTLCYVH